MTIRLLRPFDGLLKFVVELPGGKEMIFDLDEHTQVEIIEATKCWQWGSRGRSIQCVTVPKSRNEATLPSISRGAELSSWPDLGKRWSSRLVATAEENRLNIRRQLRQGQ
jgi:hypothetical protein